MEKQLLWDKICYEYDKHKFDKEEIWQVLVENYFSILGWEEQNGEITKPKIPFGSAKYLIPDIVLKQDSRDVLVVELKQANKELTDHNEKQLFSYMKQLKLKVGILWGNSIRVFYDVPDSVSDPVEIVDINFNYQDSRGTELLEVLTKKDFSIDNLYAFCKNKLKSKQAEKTNQESIDFLCSTAGEDYIKELLSIEYSKEVIEKLSIRVTDKTVKTKYINPEPITYIIPNDTELGKNIRDDLKIHSNGKESIQHYVKRVLETLYQEGKISQREIERMHDLKYSKRTFGLAFPIICDKEKDTIISGHKRYYVDKIMDNNYYLCSQWWKDFTNMYIKQIYRWIEKILHNSETQ